MRCNRGRSVGELALFAGVDLLAVNGYVGGAGDANADLLAFDTEHLDGDVGTDVEGFECIFYRTKNCNGMQRK